MEFNWSDISVSSFLGKLLRFPLRFIPQRTELRILQGKHRGLKWIAGSSNHGCWIGSYEFRKRKRFEEMVKNGFVVYDIGAHVGYYTLLASVLVGSKGLVYAFEPVPANIDMLRRHVVINAVENVTIFEYALFSRDGKLKFKTSVSSSMGHIDENGGDIEIVAITLDNLIKRGNMRPPDVMKIDVEGSEYEVLIGATGTIEVHHPIIFLATHSPSQHRGCIDFLLERGYRVSSIDERPLEMSDEIIAVYLGK